MSYQSETVKSALCQSTFQREGPKKALTWNEVTEGTAV